MDETNQSETTRALAQSYFRVRDKQTELEREMFALETKILDLPEETFPAFLDTFEDGQYVPYLITRELGGLRRVRMKQI